MKHALAIAALLALAAAAPASARSLGALEFEPCALAPAFALTTVEAWCTTLAVPENPDEPDGRRIDLAVAWVPARNAAEAAPDPVLMLAGGPGQAAREAYPQVAAAFADLRRDRHVVLVDQRGTGASAPLVCRNQAGEPAIIGDPGDSSPEAARAFAERCREQLGEAADLRFYTTTEAVADLDAVRRAIGAEQLNLVGISYGTRVAQQYARRHPQRTRTLVLDGVVPNELVLGAEHAKNLEVALSLYFERCREDPECSGRLGEPRAHLDALSRRLREAPQPVAFRDPVGGEMREEELRYDHLAGVVRLYSYAPQTAATLPLLLAEAAAGRFDLVAAQAELIFGRIQEQIAHGMQLSVMCTEDAPELSEDAADADTVIGLDLIRFSKAQCAVWPVGTRPPDFHQPLRTEIPALLLSGEFDPVTPPRYGEQVLAGLSNGRHLVLRGQGHNVLPVGCTPKLVAKFVESADAAALDTECLERLDYVAPFTGFHGWEP